MSQYSIAPLGMYTDLASISISWRDFAALCTSTDPVVGLALIESKKHNRWEWFSCCQHSPGCNQSMNAAQTAGFYSFLFYFIFKTSRASLTPAELGPWSNTGSIFTWLSISGPSLNQENQWKIALFFPSISLTHQMYLEKLTEKHRPFIFLPSAVWL